VAYEHYQIWAFSYPPKTYEVGRSQWAEIPEPSHRSQCCGWDEWISIVKHVASCSKHVVLRGAVFLYNHASGCPWSTREIWKRWTISKTESRIWGNFIHNKVNRDIISLQTNPELFSCQIGSKSSQLIWGTRTKVLAPISTYSTCTTYIGSVSIHYLHIYWIMSHDLKDLWCVICVAGEVFRLPR
jgi:hypothetical protein